MQLLTPHIVKYNINFKPLENYSVYSQHCHTFYYWNTAMTLDKAREMLQTQIGFGGGYNRNGAKLILIEVQRDHGMAAYDRLVKELEIETHFGFKPVEKLRI